MSLFTGTVTDLECSFPRVSGDEPGCELTGTRGDEFSPRERG